MQACTPREQMHFVKLCLQGAGQNLTRTMSPRTYFNSPQADIRKKSSELPTLLGAHPRSLGLARQVFHFDGTVQ